MSKEKGAQLAAHKQDLADKLQGIVSTCCSVPQHLAGDPAKQVSAWKRAPSPLRDGA